MDLVLVCFQLRMDYLSPFCFQIRTLGMLRSRFQSLPGAFNARLIPLEKKEKAKKGLKAALSRKFDEVKKIIKIDLAIY